MNWRNIKSVIFDFDGTLCSDRYFKPLGQKALDAIAGLVFGENSERWADPWMRGDLSSADVASYLSTRLSQSPEAILAALQRGCSELTLNPAVVNFATQQRRAGRKTALVTANMDVFTEVVVPAHALGSLFDVVLNTSDHRTLDKSILWNKAFDSFGPGYSFGSSLLVEDGPKMVALFQSLGGYAYQYRGDDSLRSWLAEAGYTEEARNHPTALINAHG